MMMVDNSVDDGNCFIKIVNFLGHKENSNITENITNTDNIVDIV